jgi:hypothetical protein
MTNVLTYVMTSCNDSHMNPTHTLTLQVPTTRDYLNGGFGDLVAQCSCGQHEYVYSRREGAYWHELHVAQPMRDVRYLLLNAPMPEGWEAPATAVKAAPAARVSAERTYTCPRCVGVRTIETFGPIDGRFYHHGERATCPACSGSGVTLEWVAA